VTEKTDKNLDNRDLTLVRIIEIPRKILKKLTCTNLNKGGGQTGCEAIKNILSKFYYGLFDMVTKPTYARKGIKIQFNKETN
jgi:hypothetical protein